MPVCCSAFTVFKQAARRCYEIFLFFTVSHWFINKKTTAGPDMAACRLFSDVHGGHQPCCGAPTGQVSAHAPHSVQVSASITYFPSPSEIALTGHSASHAPQEMQSSFITYAIWKHLLLKLHLYCIIVQKKSNCFPEKSKIYISCIKFTPSLLILLFLFSQGGFARLLKP